MNMMVNIKGEAKLGPIRLHENIMIDHSEGVMGTDFIIIKRLLFFWWHYLMENTIKLEEG